MELPGEDAPHPTYVGAMRPFVPLLFVPMLLVTGCSGALAASSPSAESRVEAPAEPSEPAAASSEPEPSATEAPPEPPPEPPAPTVPRAWPDDPHALVLADIEGSCSVRGVHDGFVYVQSRGLHRIPRGGGAPALVHPDESHTGGYRVAYGRAVHVRSREHGLVYIDLVSLDDGTTTTIDDTARATSWALGPNGVYWGDNTYTEPAIFHIPYAGGEREQVQELRPVLEEDRIEQLVESDGELFFVADRVRLSGPRGFSCHEVFGGPASRARNLVRGRACPRDGGIIHALSVGPRFVYYWRDEVFYRVPRRGGREERVAFAPGLPQGSWSDDRVLIWQDWRGLVRLPLEPGAPLELIAERAWMISGIDVADGQIYWTRREANEPCRVMSRPLDAPAIGPAPE